MNATKISTAEFGSQTAFHVSSVAEAAKKLGRSETSIRRELRSIGVRRVSGRVVAGFALWPNSHGTLPVALSFAE